MLNYLHKNMLAIGVESVANSFNFGMKLKPVFIYQLFYINFKGRIIIESQSVTFTIHLDPVQTYKANKHL